LFQQLQETLVHVIETNPWLAPLAALGGGILTAANPCVLAAVPLMMAYLVGQENRGPARTFLLSLTFSAGLTVMFALMFLVTWSAGSFLRAHWWVYITAAVCLLMGLHLLGVLNFTLPAPAGMRPSRKGFLGALLLGLLFGLVSLPCAGPILLVLLPMVHVKGPLFGGALLVAYSLGHCALILIGGTSVGLAQKIVASRKLQRVNLWGKRAAGLLAIGVGILLLV
jgi:cytochrome c biogenesis protein CcdA